MIPIKGFTTFDPLKHCIVGRAHDPKDVDEPLKKIMEETNEDLDALVKKLISAGVTCHRPHVETKDSRPPISPRDYFISIGENLLVGKVIAGYKDILYQIEKQKIKWYLDADISSGNMIRCGNHLHWDIGKDVRPETEKSIKNWLYEKGYKIYITRHGWHMDGVYSILKPGVIVASRDLPELQEIYPRWDICYIDQEKIEPPIKHAWGGNHGESNYDINVLSIDENICFTTSVNAVMSRFLRKHGVEPVVCTLRHKAFWDNGIHCMTQDLYREGVLEDYFN